MARSRPRAGDTEFLGYETTTADGPVVAIVRDGMEFDELTGQGEAEVVLDRTPFYAEGGGQVGDRGVIREPGGGSELFSVEDTQKPVGGLIVHRGTLHGRLRVGETVSAVVDAERRAAHDAQPHRARTCSTGRCVTSSARVPARRARSSRRTACGSTSRSTGALTDEEIRAIQDEVRRVIREDRTVTPSHMTMQEAIDAGADAFFDEKYGETVRTVRVEGYCHELCGGTHCRATRPDRRLRHHRRAASGRGSAGSRR